MPKRLAGRLILWFGGLSLIVLLVTGYYLGRMTLQELAAAQGEALHARARAAAIELSNSLIDRELEIGVLSQAPHMLRGNWADPDVKASIERRRRMRPEYAWIGVSDTTGQVRHATDGFLVGQKVDTRPWFRQGLQAAHVGDVHEAVLLARLIEHRVADGSTMRFIDFAVPIHAEGGVLGVLAAHVHWDWVWQTAARTLDDHELGAKVELLILDRKGEILYPSRLAAAEAETAKALPANLRHQLQPWADGQRYLTSVVTVPATPSTDLGWRVVLRQPEPDATAGVRALRNELLLIGLLGIGLIVLAAYLSARRIARPIEELTRAAWRVQSGGAEAVFPGDHGILELQRLSGSLRSMTATLLAQEKALEQKVQERTAELERANAELERRATTDALTGLYNRRRLHDRLEELLALKARTGRGFAVMMLDIDHFKRVNDTHGHDAGDQVLKTFAQLLRGSVRETDVVARFGGEEFTIALTETATPEAALCVAEKIRAMVESTPFPIPGPLTVSIGVHIATPKDRSVDDLVKAADGALYAAKRGAAIG